MVIPPLVGGEWLNHQFLIFQYIYWVSIIIPIDVHIFQRGGLTTNQYGDTPKRFGIWIWLVGFERLLFQSHMTQDQPLIARRQDSHKNWLARWWKRVVSCHVLSNCIHRFMRNPIVLFLIKSMVSRQKKKHEMSNDKMRWNDTSP